MATVVNLARDTRFEDIGKSFGSSFGEGFGKGVENERSKQENEQKKREMDALLNQLKVNKTTKPEDIFQAAIQSGSFDDQEKAMKFAKFYAESIQGVVEDVTMQEVTIDGKNKLLPMTNTDLLDARNRGLAEALGLPAGTQADFGSSDPEDSIIILSLETGKEVRRLKKGGFDASKLGPNEATAADFERKLKLSVDERNKAAETRANEKSIRDAENHIFNRLAADFERQLKLASERRNKVSETRANKKESRDEEKHISDQIQQQFERSLKLSSDERSKSADDRANEKSIRDAENHISAQSDASFERKLKIAVEKRNKSSEARSNEKSIRDAERHITDQASVSFERNLRLSSEVRARRKESRDIEKHISDQSATATATATGIEIKSDLQRRAEGQIIRRGEKVTSESLKKETSIVAAIDKWSGRIARAFGVSLSADGSIDAKFNDTAEGLRYDLAVTTFPDLIREGLGDTVAFKASKRIANALEVGDRNEAKVSMKETKENILSPEFLANLKKHDIGKVFKLKDATGIYFAVYAGKPQPDAYIEVSP